jgi:hypothetical protein
VLESNADDEHIEHHGDAVRPGHDGHHDGPRGRPGPGPGRGGARPPRPLPPRAHRHPHAVVHESIHFSVFVPIPVPGPGMPPPPPPPAPNYDSADYIIQVGYGTAAEMAADAFAVNTLSKAGYDPWALIRVLDRLQKDRLSGALQWADSPSSLMDADPGLQTRIAEASKLISPAPAPVQTEKL